MTCGAPCAEYRIAEDGLDAGDPPLRLPGSEPRPDRVVQGSRGGRVGSGLSEVEHGESLTIFMFWRRRKLEVVLGTHINDDLLVASESWYQNDLDKLKSTLNYGTWDYENFVHLGRRIDQLPNGDIELSQLEYARSLNRIALTRERRRQLDQNITTAEYSAISAANGKISWFEVKRWLPRPWRRTRVSKHSTWHVRTWRSSTAVAPSTTCRGYRRP